MLKRILILSLALTVATAAWMWHTWRGTNPDAPTYTVASGERSDPYGINNTFGYTVKKFIGRTNGFKVEIWARPSLQMSFDVGGFELTRIKTQQWLAYNRAILLEFDYIYHDSGDSAGELALLYDFETGELHRYGDSAWLVSPPYNQERSKLSRDEFDTLIQKFSPVRERGVSPSHLNPRQ